MKLTHTHTTKEARKHGMVTQAMEVAVDYDPADNSIENIEVSVYQNGLFVAEISKLLDECEGSPLSTIVEAIDWREVYSNSVQDKEEEALQ